jgi:Arf-GAP with coiled-coil, ANK repeat and PH domain-containing protein
VALQTATVKPGAEEAADAELQFCFRVVSPARSYVLQAADDLEAVEWMECIQVTNARGMLSQQLLAMARPPCFRSSQFDCCAVEEWLGG